MYVCVCVCVLSPFDSKSWGSFCRNSFVRFFLSSFVILLHYRFSDLLWNEWIDNLALRRAFYLEANHYFNRKTELDRLAVLQQGQGCNKGDDSGDFFKKKNRPPNICNPELRDTPPSIGLYSVLYQLPSSLLTYESDGHTQIEREQKATAKFFDDCIPNQAGFSSSVAAVTVIPNASCVAKVWKQWYTIKSKVRRLRFIRKILAEKKERNSSSLKTAETTQQGVDCENPEVTIEFHKEDNAEDAPDTSPNSQFEYDTFDVDEFAKQIGYVEETEINDIVDGLGIEQLNMFANESALAAGGMCIYGKVDQLIVLASIEDLIEMEQEAVDDLEICKKSLMEARAAVAEDESDIEAGAVSFAVKPSTEEGENASLSPRISSAASAGLRKRGPTTVEDAIANQWEEAMKVKKTLQVVPESEVVGKIDDKKSKKKCMTCCRGTVSLPNSYGSALAETSQSFLSALDHPSYVIVTFTSRQAAIAARQCLADGGSRNAWKQADDIPVPPLADAPPGNLLFFRGCW